MADGRMNCTEIALEGKWQPHSTLRLKQAFADIEATVLKPRIIAAKSLFSTMQSLNFFCTLPQDPSKTHINCQRIPSS